MDIDLRTRPVADPSSTPMKRLGQGLQTKCLIAGWDKASKQNFYGCWHMRHRRLRFVLRRSNWSSNI
ncbi:hypothetical protein OsJ_31140 [Oryza sativa Japonica Group]|uniref:Uncharacterized protein n=1 Tax=Oryza sativa subsp. japonica TaxID=39947 RepID=B9G846_ORYSJ|nr:hypothetical protein OsJ_31140 [Oryza sativa Japonica Group]